MLSFKLGIEVLEGAEYREAQSCDNCGEGASILEVRRYSMGKHCRESKICLPCESLKDQS